MPDLETIAAAVAEWRAVIGADRVRADADERARYARTTLPRGTTPCAVVRPRTTAEVSAVVEIAARHGMVVYPISRGRNLGYGDACAPGDGAAIVDLSGMDCIHEINAELGYAVIEPGVTQAQLHNAVRAQAPGFGIDATGAGRDASVLGNTVDRGFGHTSYADHLRASCDFEIVLADGRVLHTGFGHFPNARAAHVYPYGVGPALNGLFTQSNLGIVTRMTVWLHPEPDDFVVFYASTRPGRTLRDLVDALRPLRMQGRLSSAVHIGNDLRLLGALGPYPWEASGGAAPLGDAVRGRLRASAGIGEWNAVGSIAGTRAHVRSSLRALRRALRPHAAIIALDERGFRWRERAVRWMQRLGLPRGAVLARQLEAGRQNFRLLQGEPTDGPLNTLRWRLRNPEGFDAADPLASPCGVLWISPVLPALGRECDAMLDLVSPHFAKHGFDLQVTFTLINERALIAVMNIAYDKSQPGEPEAAAACYGAVQDALFRGGYYPYRAGVHSHAALSQHGGTYWDVVRAIKAALDPGDVIARGRYIPPLRGA